MNENDYCNALSMAIVEHFGKSEVFVDELIEDGVIVLNWHVGTFVSTEYVSRVAGFIFDNFSEVTQILSPCKDYKRNRL